MDAECLENIGIIWK